MHFLRFARTPSIALFSFFGIFLLRHPLLAEEVDSLTEPSIWDRTFDLRFGSGFKDNLLLSHRSQERSAFLSSGLDIIILRLPVDGTQFYFFLSGEDIRYLSGKLVDKEQSLIAISQLKKNFAENWQGGMEFQYLYQDQVVDVSTTERVGTVLAQGNAFTGRPLLRRTLSKAFWAEMDFSLTRQYFKEPLDDFWEGGPRMSLGTEYGQKSELTLSYQIRRRGYDHREQVAADGALIPNTSLEFDTQETSLSWRHNWDKERRWRSSTKVAFESNQDNGSGYFDYQKYQVAEQLRYRATTWELQGQIRLNHYDYPVQKVGPIDPAKRNQTGFVLTLHGSKNLTKKLKLFANYEHESIISNRPSDEYDVNVISAGIDREF
jgi:hypothetical protein